MAAELGYSGPFGVGSALTPEDERKFDGYTIDGQGGGLPAGKGTHEQGRKVYMQSCAACHGAKMEGVRMPGMAGDRLAGGRGTLASDRPVKTIESFWPYAPTIFDYVKRAMPFNAPGSLSNDEVYAVTAYMLGEMGIIDTSMVIDARSLPRVQMPNRHGFVPDNRPDVRVYR